MIRPLRDRTLARRMVEQDRTKGGLFTITSDQENS